MGWIIFSGLLVCIFAITIILIITDKSETSKNGAMIVTSIFLIMSIILLIISINDYKYVIYHKTITEKAKILNYNIIKNDIHILMQDGTYLVKSDVEWLNTNNIFKQISYYKDKTNIEYIVKD